MAGELLLTSPLEECAFIRPRELAAMQAAGMASVRDLLFMLPRRYEAVSYTHLRAHET